MPGGCVNATVTHQKRVLASGRVALPSNEGSRTVVQARLVGRAVVPDAGSSTEAESSGLRVNLVCVHTDRFVGVQDNCRELECRCSVGDICERPPADISARTARVRDLDVLIGLRSRHDPVEKYAGDYEGGRRRGVGTGVGVGLGISVAVGVTAGGSGTVVGVVVGGRGGAVAVGGLGVDVAVGGTGVAVGTRAVVTSGVWVGVGG